ncbi:hypothetical protein M6D81_04400 [Paenibacillus sp. J5C_2022]|uniref:hypothetical protein n=1 Tax=Paenibacillus sp. J5C2022 TaxID=2977129 RepID=UPI0021CE2CA4|nr:hypothetical protein [Paenibacillus sp. J5C2022]MCU6707946.1 hypothetical protein [Paenibacillus sp. J5C2022]
MKRLSRFSKISACMVLALVLMLTPMAAFAEGGTASKSKTVPKTPPPPMMVQPLGLYTGYTYLESSFRSIIDNQNETCQLQAQTQASQDVDTIGAKFQLQRWTGTYWLSVGPESNFSESDTSVFFGGVTKTTTSGYYYRGYITHYVSHNGTNESAVEYTATMLAD